MIQLHIQHQDIIKIVFESLNDRFRMSVVSDNLFNKTLAKFSNIAQGCIIPQELLTNDTR